MYASHFIGDTLVVSVMGINDTQSEYEGLFLKKPLQLLVSANYYDIKEEES